jgi:hypothetical protein
LIDRENLLREEIIPHASTAVEELLELNEAAAEGSNSFL